MKINIMHKNDNLYMQTPPGNRLKLHAINVLSSIVIRYSRTPLIRPPSESHWCGRIRGMVAREGFVYEQKPLSVTRNVVV